MSSRKSLHWKQQSQPFIAKLHKLKITSKASILSNGINDTLAYRLSERLTKLNMGESHEPRALADEFKVTKRTVPRELKVRFTCLPLVKSGERYRLQDAKLGKLKIKRLDQFAAISGVIGLFPKLLEKILRGVFETDSSSARMVKGCAPAFPYSITKFFSLLASTSEKRHDLSQERRIVRKMRS